MEKQKAAPISDPDIKPKKIRKIETRPTLTPNKGFGQVRSQYESTLRIFNSTQDIDDMATENDLDRLLDIWNHVKENHFVSINDNQEELRELNENMKTLNEANMIIQQLESDIDKLEKTNSVMEKSIEQEVAIQNEIIEKQNHSLYLMSIVEEHIDVVTDTLKHCEESRNNLIDLYNVTESKQQENMEKLSEQSDIQGLMEQKELMKQLELMNSDFLTTQTCCQQCENEITQITQRISESNAALEEGERIIFEDQIKSEEEIRKLSDTKKNVEKDFAVEQQENSKLAAKNDEFLKKCEDLLSQEKTLQVKLTQYEDQVKYLKFSQQELTDEETNLVKQIAELNITRLESVANKDSELDDYRKQLEDLTLAHKETADKLRVETSRNSELKQALTEKSETIEGLKNALKNKDNEGVKLNGELTTAMKKQEELSSNMKSLKINLAMRDNEICEIEVDIASRVAKENENVEKIANMRKRLTTIKQTLKDKCDDKAKWLEQVKKEKYKLIAQVDQLEDNIAENDKRIANLAKDEKELRKMKERKESEYNKKIQEITSSVNKCELAEHGKKIEEQNAKIVVLEKEIAAEKVELNNKNLEKIEKDKQKSIKKNELKNMKIEFANLKERYEIIEKTNNKLNEELNEVQYSNETKSARKWLPENSSPVLTMSYRRTESIPATSTPKESESKVQELKFKSRSSSDLSIIGGSRLFEDLEDELNKRLESNKTDAAKLSEPEARETLQTPRILSNVTAPPKYRNFFKRYGSRR